MNLFNIAKAYAQKDERGWDKVFWMIDMHDTIVPGLYDTTQEFKFYPHAREVLRFLSLQDDASIILFTCSHMREIVGMNDFFHYYGIAFDYINENPEVPDTALGSYVDKPYFNVLLDDKAGFEPSDWKDIKEVLENIYSIKIGENYG